MFETPLPEITATLHRPHTPLPALPLAPVAAAIDLKQIDLTDVALAQFGDWQVKVADVRQNLRTLALDLSTQSKVDEAKSLRFRLIGQPRADARKTSKELKSKLAQVSKAIGAREDEIVKAWDDAESLITPQIDARQAVLDSEKAERERIEREAAERHAARLAAIAMYASRCREPDMTAARIAAGMQRLEDADLTDADNARAVELADARCRTIDTMRTLHAQAVAREQEAARQEAIRIENERVAAELAAERQRIADEAAEIRRQAAELEAQRAESARLEALAVANRERLAAQQAEDARIAALAVQREQDAAAESARIVASSPAILTYGAEVQAFAADVVRAMAADVQQIEYPEVQGIRQVLKAEGESPDATDRDTPATASPCVGTMGAGQAADAAPAADLLQDECRDLSIALASKPDAMQHAREAADAIVREAQIHTAATQAMQAEAQLIDQAAPLPPAEPAQAQTDEPADIKMATLCNELGFPITEKFVRETLGVTPTCRDKRAILFTRTQRRQILAALVRHVQSLIQ